MSSSFGAEEGRVCLKGQLPVGSHQDLPKGSARTGPGRRAIPDPLSLSGHSTALREGLPGTQEVGVMDRCGKGLLNDKSAIELTRDSHLTHTHRILLK